MKYFVIITSIVALFCFVSFGQDAPSDDNGLYAGSLGEPPVVKKQKENGYALSLSQNPVIYLSGAWMNSENGPDWWFYSHEDVVIQMMFFSSGYSGNVKAKIKIKGEDKYGNKVKRKQTCVISMDFVDNNDGYMYWRPFRLPPGTYDATVKIKRGSIKGGGSVKLRFIVI